MQVVLHENNDIILSIDVMIDYIWIILINYYCLCIVNFYYDIITKYT